MGELASGKPGHTSRRPESRPGPERTRLSAACWADGTAAMAQTGSLAGTYTFQMQRLNLSAWARCGGGGGGDPSSQVPQLAAQGLLHHLPRRTGAGHTEEPWQNGEHVSSERVPATPNRNGNPFQGFAISPERSRRHSDVSTGGWSLYTTESYKPGGLCALSAAGCK